MKDRLLLLLILFSGCVSSEPVEDEPSQIKKLIEYGNNIHIATKFPQWEGKDFHIEVVNETGDVEDRYHLYIRDGEVFVV